MAIETKVCPNCGDSHSGMFEDCYPCFDCETEYEYSERREEAIAAGKISNKEAKQMYTITNQAKQYLRSDWEEAKGLIYTHDIELAATFNTYEEAAQHQEANEIVVSMDLYN